MLNVLRANRLLKRTYKSGWIPFVVKMMLEMTKPLKRVRGGRIIEEGEVAESSDEEEGEMKEEHGDDVTIRMNKGFLLFGYRLYTASTYRNALPKRGLINWTEWRGQSQMGEGICGLNQQVVTGKLLSILYLRK